MHRTWVALPLVTALLSGCDSLLTVEGTIEPTLFQHSSCEIFFNSEDGRTYSQTIAEERFSNSMTVGPGEDLYTIRVDCKAPDGSLLASRQEITWLGGSERFLYMGLISQRPRAPVPIRFLQEPHAAPGKLPPEGRRAIEERLAADSAASHPMTQLNSLHQFGDWWLGDAEFKGLGRGTFLLQGGDGHYETRSYFVGTAPAETRGRIVRDLFQREAPQAPAQLLECSQSGPSGQRCDN